MKYFTPQFWIGFNSPRIKTSKSAFKLYDRRLLSYKKQLQAIIPRLNPQARLFFRELCLLHDGTLTRLEIGDQIEKPEEQLTRNVINRRRAAVRMFVVSDNSETLVLI